MTNQTYQKIKREIKRELLEEFVIPILRDLKDAEGEYREEFVRKILKASKEKLTYVYNPKKFLRQIKG